MAKYNKINYILTILLVLMQVDFLCAADKQAKILSVFVSIQPQAYFVERIGGNRVSVEVLVLPGKNPATYAPTPVQMSRLANAEILFRIGVPFENKLVPKIQNNMDVKIVDTRQGIHLRNMKSHHHDNMDEHEVEGKDPHIWLNPVLVKNQAETICNALGQVDPLGKQEYSDNLKAFIGDLDRLDEKIRTKLLPVKGKAFFVFHPSFGYFADAYGLEQEAVEVEGKAPKGKDLAVLIKKAKKRDVRVIFVQPQFDQSPALKIASAINGSVVSLDPLAADYISNLESMANKVFDALN
jgi:zinc transport system substrate-binding protein